MIYMLLNIFCSCQLIYLPHKFGPVKDIKHVDIKQNDRKMIHVPLNLSSSKNAYSPQTGDDEIECEFDYAEMLLN